MFFNIFHIKTGHLYGTYGSRQCQGEATVNKVS
jgi:hypothetical protein